MNWPVLCMHSSFSSECNESGCVKAQSISNVLVYSTQQTDSQVNMQQEVYWCFWEQQSTVMHDVGGGTGLENRAQGSSEQWDCQKCSVEIDKRDVGAGVAGKKH